MHCVCSVKQGILILFKSYPNTWLIFNSFMNFRRLNCNLIYWSVHQNPCHFCIFNCIYFKIHDSILSISPLSSSILLWIHKVLSEAVVYYIDMSFFSISSIILICTVHTFVYIIYNKLYQCISRVVLIMTKTCCCA